MTEQLETAIIYLKKNMSKFGPWSEEVRLYIQKHQHIEDFLDHAATVLLTWEGPYDQV